MVEVTSDGRIIGPPGVRIRIPAEVVEANELASTDQERRKRLQAVFEEIDATLEDVPRQAWPKDDPIVNKFRRTGILEED